MRISDWSSDVCSSDLRDIAEIVEPILGRPLSEISYGQVLIDIVRIGTRYEVRLPRELVLVAKQMLYFERYAKLMAPDWAILNDPELIGFLFEGVHTAPTDAPDCGDASRDRSGSSSLGR